MNFKKVRYNVGENLRQASPYILFGTGVVTFGLSIASAIRATMKIEPILDNHKQVREQIEVVKQETLAVKDGEETDVAVEVVKNTEKETGKAVRKLYLRTTGRLARVYAPTVCLGGLSLASFTASVGILRGRYIMALSGLQAVTEAFEKYRARVVEDAGDEKDLEYLYGLKREKITVDETDEETGKTKKVKKDVLVGKPDGPFTYEFKKYDSESGEGSTEWDPSNTYNWTYIANIIKGYQVNLDSGMVVYLDRVLKDLGFQEFRKSESKKMAEHMAGWLPGDSIRCGLEDSDGMIIFDVLEFLNGDSPDVTLIFNARPNVFTCQKEKVNENQ